MQGSSIEPFGREPPRRSRHGTGSRNSLYPEASMFSVLHVLDTHSVLTRLDPLALLALPVMAYASENFLLARAAFDRLTRWMRSLSHL
jgi:hypothetical protein